VEDKKGRNNNSRKELNIVFSFWIVVGKIENLCVCVCVYSRDGFVVWAFVN
jgi:hypothetical protein